MPSQEVPIKEQAALNTSLKLWVKLLINAFKERYKTTKPIIMVMAKPKEKTFS